MKLTFSSRASKSTNPTCLVKDRWMESEPRVTLNICLYGKSRYLFCWLVLSLPLGSHLFLCISSDNSSRKWYSYRLILTKMQEEFPEIARRQQSLRHRGRVQPRSQGLPSSFPTVSRTRHGTGKNRDPRNYTDLKTASYSRKCRLLSSNSLVIDSL